MMVVGLFNIITGLTREKKKIENDDNENFIKFISKEKVTNVNHNLNKMTGT